MCVTATSRVRSVEQRARTRRGSARRGRRSARRAAARRRSAQTICHGTMFEWCSIAEIRTSSPGCSCGRANACATRLMPSVAFRVKMISAIAGGVEERAHLRARASYASVASSLSWCTPRWTLALMLGVVARRARRDRPAASGSSPRCRDRPAAGRAPAAAGSGSRRGCAGRRTRAAAPPLQRRVPDRGHRSAHAVASISARSCASCAYSSDFERRASAARSCTRSRISPAKAWISMSRASK